MIIIVKPVYKGHQIKWLYIGLYQQVAVTWSIIKCYSMLVTEFIRYTSDCTFVSGGFPEEVFEAGWVSIIPPLVTKLVHFHGEIKNKMQILLKIPVFEPLSVKS